MIDKYLDLARGLKKAVKDEDDGDNIFCRCAWNGSEKK